MATQISAEVPVFGDLAVYRKTDAGRQALAAPRARLGLRDRQIVLLCTGERDVASLTEVFGPDTPRDLRRLVDEGLIEAAEPTLWPDVPAEFAATLPPLGSVSARSANQSGFGVTRVPDGDALAAARGQAGVMLAEIGGAAAERLMTEGQGAAHDDDVLALLTRAIALAVQSWGDAAASSRLVQIAGLMPRAAIGRLVDGLIDEGSAMTVVPALYERLLSDTGFGAEGSGRR